MDYIYSPLIVDSKDLELVEIFKTDLIIEAYNELRIDVSRFFDKSDITLYKCKKTGYRFYYPFSSIGDAKFYEDLSKNRVNYYSRRWEHQEAFSFINKSDSVLEIGSGFGSFLSLLMENDIKSKGLELNPYAVEKCKNDGLNVEGKLIQEVAKCCKKEYDVVCSFQVLEHVTDVHSFIDSSIKTLKKNGKLIIGVPNNNPYLFVNDKYHTLNLPPHHAGLWDEKSLKSLEKIFQIKLEKIIFEPIKYNYNYFINSYIHNLKDGFYKKIILGLNRFSPSLLKSLICSFVKGRNVLAIYHKTD